MEFVLSSVYYTWFGLFSSRLSHWFILCISSILSS